MIAEMKVSGLTELFFYDYILQENGLNPITSTLTQSSYCFHVFRKKFLGENELLKGPDSFIARKSSKVSEELVSLFRFSFYYY